MCGKKRIGFQELIGNSGSPPRVREKVGIVVSLLYTSGITPACAGKSFIADEPNDIDEDHPRVCGKKKSFKSLLLGILGSPPRVREKVNPHHNVPCFIGITPACAGKRINSLIKARQVWDHPRVCGKKLY